MAQCVEKLTCGGPKDASSGAEFSASSTARRLEEWIELSVTAAEKKKEAGQEEVGESKKEEDKEDRVAEDTPIQLFTSEDGYLLRCKRTRAAIEYQAECLAAMAAKDEGSFAQPPKEPPRTVLGLLENQELLHTTLQDDLDVEVEFFRPATLDTSCVLAVARGDWTRRPLFGTSTALPPKAPAVGKTVVRFVDLTTFQKTRNREDAACKLDSPGTVFRLLRSVLVRHSCRPENIHWASPWANNFFPEAKNEAHPAGTHPDSTGPRDDVIVCLAVLRPADFFDNADSLEARELQEISKFRTGDAAPAYYMHSRVHLDHGLSWEELASASGDKDPRTSHPTTVFVFRPLPRREHISLHHPKVGTKATEGGIGKPYLGCMWETHLYSAPSAGNSEGVEEGSKHRTHDPWKDGPQTDVVARYRLLSPPYMHYKDIYPPRLFDTLLDPDNFRKMQEEALQIPQWTDWPETTHYDTSENAIWTVFPLCHTFPSNDVTRRKFIEQTCNFVPHTVSILKESLGDRLRTALFSRLGPRTELNAHTGWADLANYVLRVHIPLIVPGTGEPHSSPSVGLCGTWVDGCVETQEEGRVLVFDDSKLHRAFNYSDEDRIILIIDLERPTQDVVKRDAEADGSAIPPGRILRSLPLGYATGEHTEELDDFISQLT